MFKFPTMGNPLCIQCLDRHYLSQHCCRGLPSIPTSNVLNAILAAFWFQGHLESISTHGFVNPQPEWQVSVRFSSDFKTASQTLNRIHTKTCKPPERSADPFKIVYHLDGTQRPKGLHMFSAMLRAPFGSFTQVADAVLDGDHDKENPAS